MLQIQRNSLQADLTPDTHTLFQEATQFNTTAVPLRISSHGSSPDIYNAVIVNEQFILSYSGEFVFQKIKITH